MLEGEDILIQNAQDGNKGAFGQLYDYYIPKIYRYILLKVRHKYEAEDICHDVFLSAWQNLATYVSKGHPFSSWLYQIARNKVIDHYRTQKNHSSIDNIDEQFVKVVSTIERSVDNALHFQKVKTAMAKLSADQQDVLIMRFVEDLSHREIGSAIGKSEGAVRLIQHRALHTLREFMEKDEQKEA